LLLQYIDETREMVLSNSLSSKKNMDTPPATVDDRQKKASSQASPVQDGSEKMGAK
jgi:hypothetical protein